jgi:hypothetical protein
MRLRHIPILISIPIPVLVFLSRVARIAHNAVVPFIHFTELAAPFHLPVLGAQACYAERVHLRVWQRCGSQRGKVE